MPHFDSSSGKSFIPKASFEQRLRRARKAEKTKYEMYYKFEETCRSSVAPHAGNFAADARKRVVYASRPIVKNSLEFIPQVIREAGSQFAPFLEVALRDSLRTAACSVVAE